MTQPGRTKREGHRARPSAQRSTPRLRRALVGLLMALGLLSASAASPAEVAPAAVDTALAEAREAARADRHEQAIAAFGRAAQAAPQRRHEWLLEWADQHTWAQQLDTAIAMYREALASLGGNGRQQAAVGLARALSWADRHAEALDVYQRVLDQAPQHREARLGQARVLSWRGRHRLAAAHVEAFLRERPHDREATQILAESLDWMGRQDRAQTVLNDQVMADQGDQRAAAQLRRLQDAQRPEFVVDLRHFDQSDDLGIRETSVSWRLSLGDGRGHLRPRYAQTQFRPASGPVDRIVVHRPGLDARYRISDALEWHGSLGVDLIDTRGAVGDHRRWTHDTYLTWWPGDRWRFDAASARWTFDSEESLRQGLTAQQFKLSADHLPDELTRLTSQLSRTDYADGNRRRGLQFAAERRWVSQPRVVTGLRYSRYDFTQPGQRGYYNPEQVQSTELTLQAAGWLPRGLYWEVRGALGRESERGSPTRPIRSGSVALAWTLQPRLSLEAALDYSTSRTLDSGGFARSIARVSLKYRP